MSGLATISGGRWGRDAAVLSRLSMSSTEVGVGSEPSTEVPTASVPCARMKSAFVMSVVRLRSRPSREMAPLLLQVKWNAVVPGNVERLWVRKL